jgi:hemerythrin-like domain-containing protein
MAARSREDEDRRRVLKSMAVAGFALTGCATGAARAGSETASGQDAEEEVAPGEDLMREHGVLRRVMFTYDEVIRRLESGAELPLDTVVSAAGIVRRVIEDYHEKIEEDFLFPRLEKAGREVELVRVLRVQHRAGRGVTDEAVRLARGGLRDDADRHRLAEVLRSFNRMYRPHAAREDTVLFPAFHKLVGEKGYRELGEAFEDREKQLLGPGGFEKAVADVAKLEAVLGLDDLARFTPAS